MDNNLLKRIRLSLNEKRDNLSAWLVTTSPAERKMRLGSAPVASMKAHLESLDHVLARANDQSFGQCQVCQESVDSALLEMDYSSCVCLDHLSTAETRQLETDLEMAGQVQQTLLPHQAPEIPGLEIAAYSRPAQIIGGDYFDFISFHDQQPGVAIADVAGHGMPASLHMASVQTLLRILVPANTSQAEVVAEVQRLYRHNIRFTTFVTLFLAAFDEKTNTISYCNAGHNPPLVIRPTATADQAPSWLWPTGPAIGLLEDATFTESRVILHPGDLLVMYTDGLTEATNRQNEEVGRERLARWLNHDSNLSARDTVQIIRTELEAFTNGKPLEDDVTIVVGKLKVN